jgi:hypothetical protein
MLGQKFDFLVKPGIEFSRIDLALVSIGIILKNGIEFYPCPV